MGNLAHGLITSNRVLEVDRLRACLRTPADRLAREQPPWPTNLTATADFRWLPPAGVATKTGTLLTRFIDVDIRGAVGL